MSTSKWTSNKMGNAKKGYNKTGRDKVVAPKRRASDTSSLSIAKNALMLKKARVQKVC